MDSIAEESRKCKDLSRKPPAVSEQSRLALESDFANMWMAYQNNLELTQLEEESLENAMLNYDIAMERYRMETSRDWS